MFEIKEDIALVLDAWEKAVSRLSFSPWTIDRLCYGRVTFWVCRQGYKALLTFHVQ